MIFTTGLRYIYSDLFDSEFTPRVYLVYHLNDNIALKGGVSKGYKTPAAKQLTNGYYNYVNNNAYFGNPDLKPEESINMNWVLILWYLILHIILLQDLLLILQIKSVVKINRYAK